MMHPSPDGFRVFNTLTRTLEPFRPITPGQVGIYTCGPTVYNYAHIGNLRTYILEDCVRRGFAAAGYDVRHVMNITDVGHLESDADQGDDKMSLAAKREHRSPWEIARFYEAAFFDDCRKLGIETPTTVCRATEHNDDMIGFIRCIEQRGFVYQEDGNVYFAIDKFPEYATLARLDLENLRAGARIDVDSRKGNPLDFVLWFSKSKFPNQIMQWDSPWGRGFPGWHIECSAMATKYLGERIDIHMGGIDHIPVHHTNELAQSEACLGHKWVNYWMHCDFLVLKDAKMSKSAGTFLRLASIEERNFDPMHYRYFCMGAHYRSSLTFTWDALDAARTAFDNLKNRVIGWKIQSRVGKAKQGDASKIEGYRTAFWNHIQDDFNVPGGLGVVWEMAKDADLPPASQYDLIRDFDRVLGLGVEQFQRPTLNAEDHDLVKQREAARHRRDWTTSDTIRNELLSRGIQLMDTPEGTEWYLVAK
jgi:cysteinyl-tRNA synthetase